MGSDHQERQHHRRLRFKVTGTCLRGLIVLTAVKFCDVAEAGALTARVGDVRLCGLIHHSCKSPQTLRGYGGMWQ